MLIFIGCNTGPEDVKAKSSTIKYCMNLYTQGETVTQEVCESPLNLFQCEMWKEDFASRDIEHKGYYVCEAVLVED